MIAGKWFGLSVVCVCHLGWKLGAGNCCPQLRRLHADLQSPALQHHLSHSHIMSSSHKIFNFKSKVYELLKYNKIILVNYKLSYIFKFFKKIRQKKKNI
jgi:hypothetical protein